MSEYAGSFNDQMKNDQAKDGSGGEASEDDRTFGQRIGTAHPASFAIFAVAVPLMAFAFGIGVARDTSGLWGGALMPTWVHAVAVLFVPLSLVGIEILFSGQKERPEPWVCRLLLLINGAGLTVSVLYSIMLIPLAPFALVLALFVIGLLPLAPYFTLVAGIAQGARLRRAIRAGGRGIRTMRWTVCGALLLLVPLAVMTVRPFVGDHAADLAMSKDPSDQARAVSLARWTCGEDMILRCCYGSSSRGSFDLLPFVRTPGLLSKGSVEGYQRLYFMMTGKSFNSVPSPDGVDGRRRSWEREWTMDREVGGDAVASRVSGLSLVTSDLSIDVDREAPVVATIDWTFTFHNATARAREARTKILIPPGAVASDLSLWINGEERPAAFGTRSQVKAAYRDVAVVRRKDPALLTTAGPDRLMLQCFPVPAHGQMKTRVRITAPFIGVNDVARLRLPRFTERNFGLATGLQHGIRYTAVERPKSCPAEITFRVDDAAAPDGANGAGILNDAALATAFFEIDGPPVDAVWRRRSDGLSVAANWSEPDVDPADAVVLIADESALADCAEVDWASALSVLPDGTRVEAVRVGLAHTPWRGEFVTLDDASRRDLAAWLSRAGSRGGCDAVPALVQAMDLIRQEPTGIVVWLHGPAAVRLTAPEVLQPRLAVAPRTRLFTIATTPGPNHVIDSLERSPGWTPVTTFGAVEEAVTRVLSDGRAARARLVVTPGAEPPTGAEALGDPLLLLGTNAAVSRRLALSAPADVKAAQRIATRARLVTPVSGAVVLETKAQYERHGLDPNTGVGEKDTGTVPAVPEPETWVMIIVALCGLFVFWRRRA